MKSNSRKIYKTDIDKYRVLIYDIHVFLDELI